MSKHVLVTGASGFIAAHCIIELLNHGYTIRGTVRDASRSEKLRAMIAKHSSRTDALEFVSADLTDAASWDAAAAGCDGILHVASPVPVIQPDNADEVIRPAREGTENVLNAALKHGVSRVVVTSSVAAMMQSDRTSGTYTDDDWTNLSKPNLSPYVQSKTIAEQAAWDFVKDNHELELATVNPALVLGPALEADYGSSLEVLVILMSKQYPLLPRLGLEIVDVRDVATLQRLALEHPEAAGKRLLCANGFRWMSDIAGQVKQEFPAFDDIPSREMPNFMVKVASIFIKEIAQFVDGVGKVKMTDHTPALDLGWQPRDAAEAIRAGAQSLVDLGIVRGKAGR